MGQEEPGNGDGTVPQWRITLSGTDDAAMRTVLIAIGLLVCAAALTGCDVWDKLTGSSPAPQPPAVACNCAPPIRGARDVETERTVRVAPPRRHDTRHQVYHRYAYGHAHSWHESDAERSVDIYGYSSQSQSSSAHGYGHGEAYGYSEEYGYSEAHRRGGACCGDDAHGGYAEESSGVWADGYGRRHRYDQSAVSHYAYDAHERAKETPERLDPWHGYNDDWD